MASVQHRTRLSLEACQPDTAVGVFGRERAFLAVQIRRVFPFVRYSYHAPTNEIARLTLGVNQRRSAALQPPPVGRINRCALSVPVAVNVIRRAHVRCLVARRFTRAHGHVSVEFVPARREKKTSAAHAPEKREPDVPVYVDLCHRPSRWTTPNRKRIKGGGQDQHRR